MVDTFNYKIIADYYLRVVEHESCNKYAIDNNFQTNFTIIRIEYLSLIEGSFKQNWSFLPEMGARKSRFKSQNNPSPLPPYSEVDILPSFSLTNGQIISNRGCARLFFYEIFPTRNRIIEVTGMLTLDDFLC